MEVNQFSRAYFQTQVYVEPGEHVATINDDDYRDLLYEIYPPGQKQQRIIFQLDEHYFEVEPSRKVAANVLELPARIMNETRVSRPPEARGVLVPKPNQANWMYEAFNPRRRSNQSES